MKQFVPFLLCYFAIVPTHEEKSCDKSRVLITGSDHGFIENGVDAINYTQNTHCEWLILANNSNEFISLDFQHMDTECGYDYLFVYAGSSVLEDKLLGSFSGRVLPPKLTARGAILIVFFSDTNYVLTGFKIEYNVFGCPQNCSQNGACNGGKCQCLPGWSGDACNFQVCPDDCGNSTGKGFCMEDRCHCRVGYSGKDCSLDDNNFIGNTWHHLADFDEFLPRTGHASVYCAKLDVLVVFGGFDLNHVLDDMFIYHFNSSTWEKVNSSMPALFGHAMDMVGDEAFAVYGGELTGKSVSNQLYKFDIVAKTATIHAENSQVRPPALSKHTLTLAGDYLYLFGGSKEHGKFSNEMYKIHKNLSQWEKVEPMGGPIERLYITAHSTVFYEEMNALLVFGGIRRDVARFAQLSSLMFFYHIETRTWAQLKLPSRPQHPGSGSVVPPERAFHSASIMGNYMVVFGGYSHKHNEVEKCYDDTMYFFHLGCATWTGKRVLEHSPQNRGYPKDRGLSGHAASVRGNNVLILSGGFHGTVSGSVMAYTLPYGLSLKRNDKVCSHYGSQVSCSANPECGWCPSDGICYLRTATAKCTSNLKTVKCPGLCQALPDCQSCTAVQKRQEMPSISRVVEELHLDQCSWCPQSQQCLPRHAYPDPCQSMTKVVEPESCRRQDEVLGGATLLKYYWPPDLSYPDEVAISNTTEVTFQPVNPQGVLETKGEYVARLLGRIQVPQEIGFRGGEAATSRLRVDSSRLERLQVCVENANYVLKVSRSPESQLEVIVNQTDSVSVGPCHANLNWPSDDHMLALLPGEAYNFDFSATREVYSKTPLSKPSKMSLTRKSWQGQSVAAQVLSSNYLRPFSHGEKSCETLTNCGSCLSDASCAWCSLSGQCGAKMDADFTCKINLKLKPDECGNCTQFIYCEDCVNSSQDGQCEWMSEEARCVRKGRFNVSVKVADKCPSSCHLRPNCSECIGNPGRCVWCEQTQKCFLFSTYTADFQYGQCKSWIDKETETAEESTNSAFVENQCRSCGTRNNCSSCLQGLGCSWCYTQENPTIGQCLHGGYQPSQQCQSQGMSWAYNECPDVDECSLNLHDCHGNASCINVHGSYECKCKKGFIGDGKLECQRTCFEDCVRGKCSDGPDYKCICDLGWTGSDCSVDCGCNGHSNCEISGPGKCDGCQDFTSGEFCQYCSRGAYGNATDPDSGCQLCSCNGHENVPAGICDSSTGQCYCVDHTEGKKCDKCKSGFFGNPENGGRCFHECSAKGVIEGEQRGYLGCSGDKPGEKECLWIIKGPAKSLIQMSWENSNVDLAPSTDCPATANRVHIYDGLPNFLSSSEDRDLNLGSFCLGQPPRYPMVASSGTMSVYHVCKSHMAFNASFEVVHCPFHCPGPNRICNQLGLCVCAQGFAGPMCQLEKCPGGCGAGICNDKTNLCECTRGYTGANCSEKSKGQLEVTDAFKLELLSNSLRHYRKLLPRFGNSLKADAHGTLWLFGGHSRSGPLNDIRAFDTRNASWLPITVDIGAELPSSRYFHATELIVAENNLYIQGGMNATHYFDDFWKFDLLRRTWYKLGPQDHSIRLDLAGHTLTYNSIDGSLMLIGGISEVHGFNDQVLIMSKGSVFFKVWPTRGLSPLSGLYGHTTIFNSAMESFYVYGGIAYGKRRVGVSDSLFVLHYPSRKWSMVPAISGRTRPHPRALHAAVSSDAFMVVYGGATATLTNAEDWKWHDNLTTPPLSIFVFSCGLWIDLDLERNVQAFGMALDFSRSDKMSIYTMGGFGSGTFQGDLENLRISDDFCNLFQSDPMRCKLSLGCAHCSVFDDVRDLNATYCYSNARSKPATCTSFESGTLEFSNGVRCELSQHRQRCDVHKSCGECLSAYPDLSDPSDFPICVWCPGCSGRGKCLPRGSSCDQACPNDGLEVQLPSRCPEMRCAASDCEKCRGLKFSTGQTCSWTRKRPQSDGLDFGPIYDWSCEEPAASESFDDNDEEIILVESPCPKRCHEYTNCSDCLSSSGGEGGWSECLWSAETQSCISPSYAPLKCLGGLCGLLLSKAEHCPLPCSSHSECKSCLKNSRCGWCSIDSSPTTGIGVCTEGTFDGPQNGLSCNEANITEPYKIYGKFGLQLPVTSWNFLTCPKENECLNGHHDCDSTTQVCIDTEDGYECKCNDGYIGDAIECKPVCSKGCLHGDCVEPEKCECHFSFVGDSCDQACDCNGHSDCLDEDNKSVCLNCKNNTMGSQCQFCKPFYVGNPEKGGKCISCLEFCNGHTDICFDQSLIANKSVFTNLEVSRWPRIILTPEGVANVTESTYHGPYKFEAVCANCGGRTTGHKCEHCSLGYFGGAANGESGCKPCDCNGHGDVCDEVTGSGCVCQNNTMSEGDCAIPSGSSSRRPFKNGDCASRQCSKCKEYYIGFPENSRQCYRQMSVDTDYCLDPETQAECHRQPHFLGGGQAVFFVVLPNFMNVDIRIVIDVTVGDTEVFLSPEPRMFVVETNETTFEHDVTFDEAYKFKKSLWWERYKLNDLFQLEGHMLQENDEDQDSRLKRANIRTLLPQLVSNKTSSPSVENFVLVERQANPHELNTFVELKERDSLLHVKGLKNRLVISLPEGSHDLRTTRFFILIKSKSAQESFGFLYFRQDQLHIDLFVFFSVFFSCFFLFLCGCVVVWKIKSIFDRRRARLRHAFELQNMAQRPFATHYVAFGSSKANGCDIMPFKQPVPSQSFNQKRKRLMGLHGSNAVKCSSEEVSSPLLASSASAASSSSDQRLLSTIRPVAIEPLGPTGKSVALATTLIEMPNAGLSFGCVLVTTIGHNPGMAAASSMASTE